MGMTLVTAAADIAVTLTQAKAHLRVTSSADDTLISALILSAQDYCETYTGRAIMTQTWDLTLDEFPQDLSGARFGGDIRLPMRPIQSITHIKYVDTSGVLQTISASDYRLDAASDPPRITPAFGKVWPTPQFITASITTRFIAGHTSAAAVPDAIKHAALLMIGHLYENREGVVIGTITGEVPFAIKALLDTYKTSPTVPL